MVAGVKGKGETVRDSRCDTEYFDKFLKNAESGYSKNKARVDSFLEDPGELKSMPVRWSMMSGCAFSMFQWAYAVGRPLDEVRASFERAVDAFVLMKTLDIRFLPAKTIAIRHNFRTLRDTYVNALWILSLSVLLGCDGERVRGVLAVTGNEGADGVFDRLAVPFTPDRVVADGVVCPAPYRRLLAVFDAPKQERPKLMRSFLGVWYQQNKSADWWGEAERVEAGSLLYSGYWCFEAAAVVKMLGIDDSSFRDCEYYPADLVHFSEAGV